jgi:PAS domain-containing protein
MHIYIDTAEAVLAPVVAEAASANGLVFGALEAFDAPIYVTDSEGFVTFFNSACIHFSGRTPVLGRDRWCVTWKLFTTAGDYLPHEQCPMAQAIRTGGKVRGLTAIAARPDGTRVRFMPFPTPLFDASGALIGAINILIDITDDRQIENLVAQAERSRRLAQSMGDRHTTSVLEQLAAEYDAKAAELRGHRESSGLPS